MFIVYIYKIFYSISADLKYITDLLTTLTAPLLRSICRADFAHESVFYRVI